MKNLRYLLAVLLVTAGFAACGSGNEGENNGGKTDSSRTDSGAADAGGSFEKNGLKVKAIEDSPQYPDATLSLVSPGEKENLKVGKNTFQFKVENFTLGEQTADAAAKGLANSKDGQHIHFILNNEPYHAHYGDKVEHELKEGHYILLSFLSRSYHESVKSPGAFLLRQITVGSPKEELEAMDMNAPHLFFSRPKGEYYGDDTRKLLLDFYLVNCDLSPGGYKVKATINGTEFIFTKWAPYSIEGLPLGDVKIRLELLDPAGKPVASPFNGTERTVKLLEKKPA